ncbi:MAG TPA: DUF2785 domain-containing protein [Symbiobacteriaceae bacterium]|nr:DUF2785 domain-containing protein [Symbiobacteriaceae bacterium]
MLEKQFLRAIKESNCVVPEGHTATSLLPDLMTGLGSTDPEYRDLLCLEVLWDFVAQGLYTPDELRAIARQLMENLRKGIGETEGDQVFLRTFSVLILGAIVTHDAKARFLTAGELGTILDAGLEYLAAEQDLRGYLPDQGWAHSAAHTADLLRELARHPALGATELERILWGIVRKVIAPAVHPFLESEDGRLGYAFLAVLRRELVPLSAVAACIDELRGTEPRRNSFVPGRDSVRYHNARIFLQCLHVMLAHPDLPAAVKAELPGRVYAAMKSFTPVWL